MKPKPVDWTFDGGTWCARVMGLQLAVVGDADGSYTASMTADGKRPELQKGFVSPLAARDYCVNTMLAREYGRYFAEPPATSTTASIRDWFTAAVPSPTADNVRVQAACVMEEVAELIEACDIPFGGLSDLASRLRLGAVQVNPASVPTLDALCDVIVTCVGLGYMLGFDVEQALVEVNRSNFTRFEDGKPVFDEAGKVKKGRNYEAPDLRRFVCASK